MKKIISIIGIVLCVVGGIFIGYKIFSRSEPKTTITSFSILTALKKEGFLITQTYLFNQKIEIEISSGSEWKDIFWGQKIEAVGNMKVSSGVDFKKITDQDVEVSRNSIIVHIPPIEEKSVELLGDITLSNKQGILKNLFDSDDGYNLAYARLKQEAEKAAAAPEIRQEAEENAKAEIEKLLKFIDQTKDVKVVFKN